MIGFDLNAVFKSRKLPYKKTDVVRNDGRKHPIDSISHKPLIESRKTALAQSNKNFLKPSFEIQFRNSSKDQHQLKLAHQLSLRGKISKHIISHVKGTCSSSNFNIQNMSDSTKSSVIRKGRNNKSQSRYDAPKYLIKLSNHGYQNSTLIKPTIQTMLSMNTEPSDCLQNGISEPRNGLSSNLENEVYERPMSIQTNRRHLADNNSIKSMFSLNIDHVRTQERFFESRAFETSKENNFQIISKQAEDFSSYTSMIKLVKILRQYIDNQKIIYSNQVNEYCLKIDKLKRDLASSDAMRLSLLKEISELKTKTLEIISKLTVASYKYASQELESKVSTLL